MSRAMAECAWCLEPCLRPLLVDDPEKGQRLAYHPRCRREQLVWARQIQQSAGLSELLHPSFELTQG